jgi:hypothetical protein
VAGKSGFDRNFGGFKVSNFADQNDVGILPQESAQGSGEVEADLLLHLHLVDTAELELNGIFRGHDVGVDLIELRDRRIQGVRFA